MSLNNDPCSKKIRFTNLDILKFAAAVLIICHHFQQTTGIRYSVVNFWEGGFYVGYLSELFFMISGYLMQHSFKKRRGGYIGFFLYKYVRLLPTVFLACIFQLGVMYVFYKINGAGLFGGFYPVSDVIATLLLVQYGYIARPTAVNAAVWYLCVLVQCYLIYCLIQFVCEKSGGKIKVWHLYAVTVFLSLMSDFLVPKSLYLPFLNDTSSRGITTFFTGALIYMLQKSDKKMLLRALRVISVCLCIPAYFLLYRSVYVLMFMAYPLLVDAASSAKQLGGKVFAFLGDITLDMYLWHIPMIYLFFAILLTMGLISLDTVFMLCAVVVITIIFAAVYNVLAEKPMQRAIKNLFAANTREAEKDAV